MFVYSILMLFRGKELFPAMAFLVIVMLIVLTFSISSQVPYQRNELFPKYGMYEGMAEGEIPEEEEEKEKEDEKENFEGEEEEDESPEEKKEGFTLGSLIPGGFDFNKILATAMGTKPASEDKKEEKKEGFAVVMPRLTPGSFADQAVVLDKFTKITKNSDINDPNCYSAGLSNSRGALCLSPELIDMLKTRGGNM